MPIPNIVTISSGYKDIKGDTKCTKYWFTVLRGNSRSLE